MEIGILLTSLWLGILTSISPCQLTTNIAAVSFVGRKVGSPSYVIWSGIFYTLGRAALYTLLGFLLSFSLSSIPLISQFLQTKMLYIMSPLLILFGLMTLGIIKFHSHLGLKNQSQNTLVNMGLFGSFILGIFFALTFCPISAALYFSNLITTKGNLLALLAYGVGTSIPVIIFSFILAFSTKTLSYTHNKIVKIEKWARYLTGTLFILVGLHFLTDLGIDLNILNWFTYLANYITYDLLGLLKTTAAAQSVHFFIEDSTKIIFLLFLVTGTISFFRTYLNAEKVREYLENKPKWLGYFLAAILGAITPFCSCSSIPLFIGFIEAGIPFGITMSFLISSPLISEITIVVLGGTIGWHITWIYVITGMIMGIIGGLIMEKLGLEKYVEGYVYKIKMAKNKIAEASQTPRDKFNYAANYSWDIVKKVWLYVLIGVGIGAALHGYVPTEFFTKYLSKDNLFAVPMAVLVGIPLYANDTGIIPIAQVLIAKSVPLGTVFAMMMSVVAISLPELIILRKVMTKKLIVYFVGLLFILITIIGYFYNWIF